MAQIEVKQISKAYQDKVIFKEYKEACHNEHFWRAIFPDFLKYAFEGK